MSGGAETTHREVSEIDTVIIGGCLGLAGLAGMFVAIWLWHGGLNRPERPPLPLTAASPELCAAYRAWSAKAVQSVKSMEEMCRG